MNTIKLITNTILLTTLLVPMFVMGAISGQVSGTWTSRTGGSNVQGIGTNTLSWGSPNDYRSAYKFTPASAAFFPITLNQTFDLGTFTHMNKLIPINTAITAATLSTKLNLNIDGTVTQQTFNFNFLHNETPNIAGTCPSGSASICDDIVTLTNNSLVSKDFVVDGKTYQFTLLGFYYNGSLLSSFLTKEKFNNNAILKGVITLKDIPVPEPTTYLLLGSTLLVGLYLKKRKGSAVKDS